MWLSQIMRWEFYCSSLWGDDSGPGPWLSGALCWLARSHSGPPAMHFKVGDQGLTCAWHPENDNASASLHLLLRAGPGDTKARRAAPALLCCVEEVLIQEGDIHKGRGQCSMCILYKQWWVEAVWGQEEGHGGDRVAVTAGALIDKIQHHTAYL